MKASFLQSILANRLAVLAITVVIGILVARMIHDMMSTHDRTKRPLLVASVANISILALIWASEFAFQKNGWLPSAIAWLPQEWYLPLSLVLVVISLIRKSPASAWLNTFAALFVAGVLMGPHFTSPAALAKSESMSVMTLDVEHWTDGAKPVVDLIGSQKPTVFCLQESGVGNGVKGKPLAELQKSLPAYRLIHEGQMTIGSTEPIDRVSSTTLTPGPADSPGLVAAVHDKYHTVDVVDFWLVPCDTQHAVTDPAGYFKQFTQDRDAQAKALLGVTKSLRGLAVVCGDFNGPPQVSGSKLLTAKLQDAFEQSGNGYGYTTPAKVPCVRTDRILMSADLTAQTVSNPAWSSSTHLPVLAQIQISGK